ncbi:MAG: hypothetical protein WBX05_18435, partial [Pseudolabrys sp.]
FSRIAVYGRDIQSSSRTVRPRNLNDMREMSLAEFGWKLCATAALWWLSFFQSQWSLCPTLWAYENRSR